MPLYTWSCKKCKKEFDEMQSLKDFDDKVVVKCPTCGKNTQVERKIVAQKSTSASWSYWRR